VEPFPQPLVSIAAPVIRDNIDTDIIIPSREIRSTGKTGLKAGLFAPWRYIDVEPIWVAAQAVNMRCGRWRNGVSHASLLRAFRPYSGPIVPAMAFFR